MSDERNQKIGGGLTCSQVWETNHVTVTAAMSPYTVEITDRFFDVDCSGGNVTLQLPLVASSLGKKYDFHKTDASANRVVILPQPGEFVNGLGAKLLHLHRQAVGLRCATTEWEVNYEPSRFNPLHIDGLGVEWVSATQLRVLTGSCRDSTDAVNIVLTSSDTADITVAGDRDFVPAGNQWVYVHVITDSLGTNSPRAFLSTSATAPVLPAGWDKFRRVGVVRSLVILTIQRFNQTGGPTSRRFAYDVERATVQALAAGNAIVFTPVSLAAFVPPTSRRCELVCTFDTTAPADLLRLRPTGSVVVEPVTFARPGIAAPTGITNYVDMNTNAAQSIDYRGTGVGDSTDIFILSYFDEV